MYDPPMPTVERVGLVVERLYGRVLLGPVPCQACRTLVTWDGMDWHFAGTMLLHRPATCPGPARAAPLASWEK